MVYPDRNIDPCDILNEVFDFINEENFFDCNGIYFIKSKW